MHVKVSVRIKNALVSVIKLPRKYIIRINFYYREKCLIYLIIFKKWQVIEIEKYKLNMKIFQ